MTGQQTQTSGLTLFQPTNMGLKTFIDRIFNPIPPVVTGTYYRKKALYDKGYKEREQEILAKTRTKNANQAETEVSGTDVTSSSYCQ